MRRVAALAGWAVIVVVACSDDGGHVIGDGTVYEGTFNVIDGSERGPELCDLIMASSPPQCDGLPVAGWDWEAVDGEESRGGVTWGRWHVTGTYDGERFTLTKGPGPARDVAGADESAVGMDRARRAELSRVQDELVDPASVRAVGRIEHGGADVHEDAIVAYVWAVDDDALGYARSRWGEDVVLRGLLTPIEE